MSYPARAEELVNSIINRKGHRHAANKGMDSYRLAIDHMEIRSDWQNETQFLPGNGRIDTAVWMHNHLLPITKTIQVRRTRHAGLCWRSRDELISDVLLWTPIYGRAKAGRPALTYIQQLCEDKGCSPEDLPEAMNNWEKWRERGRSIRASGTTWWWWWWWYVLYKYSFLRLMWEDI